MIHLALSIVAFFFLASLALLMLVAVLCALGTVIGAVIGPCIPRKHVTAARPDSMPNTRWNGYHYVPVSPLARPGTVATNWRYL